MPSARQDAQPGYGEFAIPPELSFVMFLVFLFVALVALFKEVLPQTLLRWRRYRNIANTTGSRIASVRVLWFFSNIFFSASGITSAMQRKQAGQQAGRQLSIHQ